MAHEPKLTVYKIFIKPIGDIDKSNRTLFRHIIGENNEKELEDSYIFMELFKKFIADLDKPEMFSDDSSKKCMTANQSDIADESVRPNILPHSNAFIFEGVVEGGSYGRKRNKTSTVNKKERAAVSDKDAITDDFYFMLYLPPHSDKMILMVQSYTDGSIDSVMKIFWSKFFAVGGTFWQPKIERHTPLAIIEEYKEDTSVSELQYTTDIAGETLLDKTKTAKNHAYTVTIKITPKDGDLSMDEFNEARSPFENTLLGKLKNLGNFRKKKGKLRDRKTGIETPFELDSDFDIQPVILLSKYIPTLGTEMNFDKIKDFCFELLAGLKAELYKDAAQER